MCCLLYTSFHNVKIQEKVLEQIVKYCAYYMPQRKFPDKAIDVLDLACVGAKRQSERSVSEDVYKRQPCPCTLSARIPRYSLLQSVLHKYRPIDVYKRQDIAGSPRNSFRASVEA